MRQIFTILMLTGLSITLKAQLVFNENFTGYSNGNLNGQGSWISNADPNPDIQVDGTSPLIFSGYSSGTQYITVNGGANAKDAFKLFSAPVSTASARTIFTSFVVRVTGSATNTSTATDYSVSLLNTANSTLPCKFYVRWQNGNNRRIFGVGVGSEVPAYKNTGNSSSTHAFLIVIRYDIGIGANDDAAYMWIDPSLAAEPLIADADASHVGGGEIAYGSQINALMIHQTGGNSPDAAFDAFRVATGTTSALAWQNLSPSGASLPVKLDNFDAAKDGNGVKLVWNTSDEIGIKNYVVEKSADGFSFTSIGSVDAQNKKTYSFTDIQPSSDNSFYRLKMVDLDGNFKLSHVVSIKSKTGLNIILSPNPVKDVLVVQHPKAEASTQLQVVNADGRMLKNVQVPANAVETTIDFSGFRSGMYYIVFKSTTTTVSK